jgi:hypothetical protein
LTFSVTHSGRILHANLPLKAPIYLDIYLYINSMASSIITCMYVCMCMWMYVLDSWEGVDCPPNSPRVSAPIGGWKGNIYIPATKTSSTLSIQWNCLA